jgi:hypothetical protein
MNKITNYDELKMAVDENQGILTLDMRQLRDIHNADRLGIHVRANISKELASRGLAHYPIDLPDRQHEYARIYKQGTSVATLINAVLKVEPQADSVIRKAATSNGSKILDKIRELLDEEE